MNKRARQYEDQRILKLSVASDPELAAISVRLIRYLEAKNGKGIAESGAAEILWKLGQFANENIPARSYGAVNSAGRDQ